MYKRQVYIKNQAVYAAAGVVVMFLVSKINYQTFRLLSVPGIVAAILLLVLALSPLGVELNEVKRWVRIGPIQFQPSEVAKVAVILFFATRLSKRDTEKKKKWSRRTLTGRTLERLDRIGFLELVPYGAILMVIALLMLMGGPRSSSPPGSAWAGSPPAGPWWREPCGSSSPRPPI